MRGTIDRFEGDFAVVELESGKMMNIDKNRMPKEAKEGMVVIIGDEISVDFEETRRQAKEIEELTEELWEDEN